jgi:hypothetical protein
LHKIFAHICVKTKPKKPQKNPINPLKIPHSRLE